MVAPSKVEGSLRKYIEEAKNATLFHEYRSFLKEIALHFISERPSQLKGETIINVEELLNNLYIQSKNHKWEEQKALITALGFASSLVYYNEGNRGHPDFGSLAKQLGEILETL